MLITETWESNPQPPTQIAIAILFGHHQVSSLSHSSKKNKKKTLSFADVLILFILFTQVSIELVSLVDRVQLK